MDVGTFIVAIFYTVEDWLEGEQPLRQRGPKPKLSDSEALAIEIAGEFLGIDADRGLYAYFRQNCGEWFPALKEIHRTTFCRQAANLWVAKERLWKHLLNRVRFEASLSLVDSFPVEVCRFARAYRCRLLAEESAFGYGEMAKQTIYGLRAHLRVSWPGGICAVSLAPANVHDLRVAEKLLEGAEGWVLDDRNYHSPNLAERLSDRGLRLPTPYEFSKKEKQPWPRFLVQKRRRIETVIAQMVGRYKAKKVWARDRWHLRSRWLRKILSHTLAVWLCQQANLPPLRFSQLLTD